MVDTQKPKLFKKVSLEPGNQLFSEVMANGKKYIIPRFQRDYSWESDHWDELWQDIEQMGESRTQHFMGYLVFQTADEGKLKIIDGQQRLTTLSILILAALGKIRMLIANGIDAAANEKRIDIYLSRYIGVDDLVTLKREPKLILNRHNNEHFRTIAEKLDIVAQRNIKATNRKINQAFRFFEGKFQPCQSGEEVAGILTDIADGLLFTTITVQDDLNAYTVFETLNARGLQLSTPDLLKNYLLSTMDKGGTYPEQDFLDFEEQWDGILEQLGETEFTNFLRSYRGMHKKLVSKRDLFRVLKNDVQSPQEVPPYLDDMKEYAAIYAALQNSHDEFWNEDDGKYSGARSRLEALQIFNIKTPLSLLMAGYKILSSKDFVKLLQYIVVVSIRYNVICGKSPNNQERIYNEMANNLITGRMVLSDMTNLLEPLYSEKEFVPAFTDKTMLSRRSNKKIMFLLRQLEKQLSQEEPSGTLTLEHVLPFSPDDPWQEYFGRDNYENAIDRLGNMALLSSRKNMGQETFAEKREILRNSPYHINRHIAEYEEWDMDSLKNHQEWLAKQAKTVWKISQLEQGK